MTSLPVNAERLAETDASEYRRRVRAWIMYDWANSAFATTVLAAVLPFYYSAVAGATLPSPAVATQYWSLTLSASIFIVAILSPILGTISDIKRGKKRFLSIFVTLGVIGTGLLVLIDTGDWLLASILFLVGRVGFAGANVFYDALLPHVARDADQDKVSAQGYAFGYLGGGILLAVNVAMIQLLPDNWGVRLSLLTVAIWWALFSIPLFRRVPEPLSATEKLQPGESLLRVSFGRVLKTLREIRQYQELFKFLVAFLIYNDGIGIIISIAAIYAAELGFGLTESVLAILLVQFVGMPFSLVFGNLPGQADRRQSMFTAFIVFNIIFLPLIGLGGRFLLPGDLVGVSPPPFADTTGAVGQGDYFVGEEALTLTGPWEVESIEADVLGTEEDIAYAFSTEAGAQLDLSFNGRSLELTYGIGPEHGVWAVLLDGEPVTDNDGEPVLIDAYHSTVRYGETETFTAEAAGEHRFTLVNTGRSNEASEGTRISVSQVAILPPARTSNLGIVLGMLIGLEVVGILFAFLAGPLLFFGLADRLRTKQSIMLALVAYSIIAIWGFFIDTVVEFWFMAWMVAVVQGGSQALSRSLYAAMSPSAMSGEFFGFFSIMSKFASFLSPLVFAAAVALFDSSRPAILSLIGFFLIGLWLLNRVDVAEGKKVADAKDKELLGAA